MKRVLRKNHFNFIFSIRFCSHSSLDRLFDAFSEPRWLFVLFIGRESAVKSKVDVVVASDYDEAHNNIDRHRQPCRRRLEFTAKSQQFIFSLIFIDVNCRMDLIKIHCLISAVPAPYRRCLCSLKNCRIVKSLSVSLQHNDKFASFCEECEWLIVVVGSHECWFCVPSLCNSIDIQ